MENQSTPSVPMQVSPIPQTGLPEIPARRKIDLKYLLLIFIIIGIAGGYFIGVRPEPSKLTPTPTDTPTPTPKKNPSVPVATYSAYIDLTVKTASLSSYLERLHTSESTLLPPTIELPLGFPNM